MTRFIADLHIHSRYSRATSRQCDPENLHLWAGYKGIDLIGTGDFTHAKWREELKEKLEPSGEGLYSLKEEFKRALSKDAPQVFNHNIKFIVTGEISSIYKKNGRVRKVHNLIVLPGLEEAERLSKRLEKIGNLHSDGRPILGLDSHDLLEISLEVCPEVLFIPAHIWTPHFSLFGANSGFDSIEECFEDLVPNIYALETGLSSDPEMNWRLSALDEFTLVSNSDAHSPGKIGRESNLFDTELSYSGILKALKGEKRGGTTGFLGTIEFFPEEGKYHYDGHRNCKIRWTPRETKSAGGICSVCGHKVTVGVLHRVEELADREEGIKPSGSKPFYNLIPLPEIIGNALGRGPNTKTVTKEYFNLIMKFGSELNVLRETPISQIAKEAGSVVAEAIRRLRDGQVYIEPGFDGEYGIIQVISDDEREKLKKAGNQISLTGTDSQEKKISKRVYEPPNEIRDEGEGVKESSATLAPVHVSHGLNDEQNEAVIAEDGPIMVIAGPGTGKTRTLTMRIAHLIGKGIKPEEITAVTFTNRAAAEIKARLTDILKYSGDEIKVNIGTFHSLCMDILTQEKDDIVLFDQWDTEAFLLEILGHKGKTNSKRIAIDDYITVLKRGTYYKGGINKKQGIPNYVITDHK